MPRFLSQAVEPEAETFDADRIGHGEPSLPRAFRWGEESLVVDRERRAWRSSKVDRGDSYVDKHWFEFATPEGTVVIVYFHRRARAGQPRWWLFSIDP